MIKISYLMRRLPHLSLEEFQSYWSEKHSQDAPSDAFSRLGVKRYVQVLPLETDARNLVIGPRTGLVEPSIRPASGSGTQRLYSFRDILVLRIVKRLIDTGVSLPNIRIAVEHLAAEGGTDLARITLMSDVNKP